MKKRLFFVLLAALMMPLVMVAQQNLSVHIDETVNACGSYTWAVNGTTYNTSGVHTVTSGDTLYILDLTIHQVYTTTLTEPVNGGCTYSIGDSTFTNSGNHSYVFKTAQNCDSTVHFNLVLSGEAARTYTVTACESYSWKDSAYTTSGTFYYEDSTNAQCDSLLTLELTVIAPDQKSYDTTVVACESARFRFYSTSNLWYTVTTDGTVITSEEFGETSVGRQVMHPRTVQRCLDSLVTVTFNIKKNGINSSSVQACDEYTITVDTTTRTYTFSKLDTITIKKGATNSCDSLVIINLTVKESPTVYITGDLRVPVGSNATLHAQSDQEVSYSWSNGSTADSIVLSNVMQNTDVSLTGTNSFGCESTSHVTVMANASINDVNADMVSVYPNPAKDIININSAEAVKNVTIFNTLGQAVMSIDNTNSVDLHNLANGNYVVRIELHNGAVATRTVILSK